MNPAIVNLNRKGTTDMQLKNTLRASVGEGWLALRSMCTLGILASGAVYYWSSAIAFAALLVSSLMLVVLTGREYMIASIQRIRTITELRERLLTYGDNEYILRGILSEQVWRGETPDPEVVKRLEDYSKSRAEFEAKIMDAASKLFGEFKAETKTEAN